MQGATTFVGMDVHRGSIFVALISSAGATDEWQVENKPVAVRRLAKKLKGLGDVVTCYEAGPCGFEIDPSWWTPQEAGEECP